MPPEVNPRLFVTAKAGGDDSSIPRSNLIPFSVPGFRYFRQMTHENKQPRSTARHSSFCVHVGVCRALNQRRLSGVVKALCCCILGPYREYSVSDAPQMALYDPPKSIRRQCPTRSQRRRLDESPT